MLSENLSRVRKERGLTQEALAVKLNVVRQTVSKWEKGAAVPDADTLCRIAEALEVPVSSILGDSVCEEQPDMTAIAKTLAQINEQLAVRNRRTAAVWKLLCLILCLVSITVTVCFHLWKAGRGSVHENGYETSEINIPDIVEVSGVDFLYNGDGLTCIFVPSVGDRDITYTVGLNCSGTADITAEARYENGICTASFDRSELTENTAYSAVLSLEYHGEVRNVIFSEELYFGENGCSWRNVP